MRPLPLLALLLLGGCGSSRSGLARTSDVQHTTTEIETGEGVTYSISQIVERSVSTDLVDGTVEAAWKALPEVYRELGVPVTMVDPRTLMLGTADNRLSRIGKSRPSRYLDCGSGLAGLYANIYSVSVSVVTQVQPSEGGGISVDTQLEASARDPAHNNNALRCTTRGVLEREIVETLQARLSGATG